MKITDNSLKVMITLMFNKIFSSGTKIHLLRSNLRQILLLWVQFVSFAWKIRETPIYALPNAWCS